MRIAYLISAYKDPRQLLRMVATLERPGEAEFFVHVDANVDIEPFRRLLLPGRAHTVHFTDRRYHVMWGGFNQVRYQREMLRCCLSSGTAFDRIFILTGQDFPLWSHRRLIAELVAHPDREYIKGLNLSTGLVQQHIVERVTIYHLFRDFRWLPLRRVSLALMRFLPLRKRPWLMVDGHRWDVWVASSYMCITSRLARHILRGMESRQLMDYFKTSYVAEELVIPTIVYNSPYASHCLPNPDSRYEGLSSLSAVTWFDYGKGYIKVWTEQDYDELRRSDMMFARKFETGRSDTLMDRLDRENQEV